MNRIRKTYPTLKCESAVIVVRGRYRSMATWPDFLFLTQNSSYFCCQQGFFASTLTLHKSLVRYGNTWAVQFSTRQASLNPPFVMVRNVFANVDYGLLYSAVAVDEGAHSVPCHELSWPLVHWIVETAAFQTCTSHRQHIGMGELGMKLVIILWVETLEYWTPPTITCQKESREQTFVQHDLAASEGDWWENPSRLNVPWRCWEYSYSIRLAHF